MVLHDSASEKVYATGGQIHVPIYVTGIIKVNNAEIAVLDNDLGSVETQKTLDLAGDDLVSLTANHLQKLRFSFQLTTPRGHAFKPHQDFLGWVEKFYYLSGRYDIELTVGDALMENSFLQPLGHVELDLPEAPEKAARLPPLPVDPSSRYGPKAEIFRAPEKRPPQKISYFLEFDPFAIHWLFGWAITLGGEFEGFSCFSTTCYICHPIPSWHCFSSVALCTFLVEAGLVHYTQNSRSFGSLSDVCGTHNSCPSCFNQPS